MGFDLRGLLVSIAASLLLLPAAARADVEAELRDAAGRSVGEVTLREAPHGVVVHAKLDGIPPGEHALHIHERGRCEGDFSSAGGHFAPGGRSHGFLNPKGPHAGDLPNLFVPSDGKLEVEFLSTALKLGDGKLLDADGAAVVVHAGADDYVSDPAGDAGGRIACGVIGG